MTMAVSWIYRLSKEQLTQELEKHELDTSGSLAVLRNRMVSFARQNPGLFAEKPKDPPDYKEDPDRTKDLEDMEEELQELREVLVASSTRREVIAPRSEEEPPTSPQLGPALDQGLLGQLRLLNHLPGTSRERAPDTLGIQSPENLRQNTGHTLDQMRKWNCHFDEKGVYEFLERVRKLQRAYQLTDQQLLRGFQNSSEGTPNCGIVTAPHP